MIFRSHFWLKNQNTKHRKQFLHTFAILAMWDAELERLPGGGACSSVVVAPPLVGAVLDINDGDSNSTPKCPRSHNAAKARKSRVSKRPATLLDVPPRASTSFPKPALVGGIGGYFSLRGYIRRLLTQQKGEAEGSEISTVEAGRTERLWNWYMTKRVAGSLTVAA